MFHRRGFAKRGEPRRPSGVLRRPLRLPNLIRATRMSLRRDLYEKMVEERVAAELESRREERRYWIITLLVCLAWCVLGAVITGAGFAMQLKAEDAKLLIDAGQGIAAAGVLATVTYAGYHRRKRGLE